MRYKRFLSIVLALSMVLSPVFLSSEFVMADGGVPGQERTEKEQAIEYFVSYTYYQALGYDPSSDDLDFYVEGLASGEMCVLDFFDAVIDSSVIDGPETNEDFVTFMYKVVLGRAPKFNDDTDAWISALDQYNVTRDEVYAEFLHFDEFLERCDNLDITYGKPIDEYIDRTFHAFLERYPMQDERSVNRANLLNGNITGPVFAGSLLESVREGVTAEEFVEIIYEGVLFRTPETEGVKSWAEKLKSGEITREALLHEFLYSDEYEDICYRYDVLFSKEMTINSFVKRTFAAVLNERATQEDLDYWVPSLTNKEESALDLFETLWTTEAYLNFAPDNKEYVESLYKAIFFKAPDAEGVDYFVGQLDNGSMTRYDVFMGFLFSEQYQETCDSLDILGELPIDFYVIKTYRAYMGGWPTKDQRKSYASALKDQSLSATAYISEFIENSDSAFVKGANDEFVNTCYNGILMRLADQMDLKYWVDQLDKGSMTREDVLKGFINSETFKGVCNYYGLLWERYGEEPTATPTATVTPTATATATATPKATATATPKATATAKPTATAAPTATTAPSKPTATTVPSEPTATVTPTTTPEVTIEPSSEPKKLINDFVDRIYTYVLNREPEAEGAAFWTDELYSFRRTGAEVAQGFIFSDEFINRNTSNEEFVTILYNTFFGREPDADGMKYWISQLESGAMSRVDVANGFIYSLEWANTCATYGIMSGGTTAPSVEIEPTELTYAFVERMYTTALKRASDEAGKEYWAKELSNFRVTGESVGLGFFLSDEVTGYNLDSTEFVNRLYKTFMDRDADVDGAAYWVSVLDGGTTRYDVVLGFTHSEEFINKCIEARIKPF